MSVPEQEFGNTNLAHLDLDRVEVLLARLVRRTSHFPLTGSNGLESWHRRHSESRVKHFDLYQQLLTRTINRLGSTQACHLEAKSLHLPSIYYPLRFEDSLQRLKSNRRRPTDRLINNAIIVVHGFASLALSARYRSSPPGASHWLTIHPERI